MKPEVSLWKRLKGHLPGTADRAENVAMVGMPDVYGVWERWSYWIELKAPRVVGRVDDPIKYLSPSQLAWHTRHAIQGAPIYVLVESETWWTLFQRQVFEPRVTYVRLKAAERKPGGLLEFGAFIESIGETRHE